MNRGAHRGFPPSRGTRPPRHHSLPYTLNHVITETAHPTPRHLTIGALHHLSLHHPSASSSLCLANGPSTSSYPDASHAPRRARHSHLHLARPPRGYHTPHPPPTVPRRAFLHRRAHRHRAEPTRAGTRASRDGDGHGRASPRRSVRGNRHRGKSHGAVVGVRPCPGCARGNDGGEERAGTGGASHAATAEETSVPSENR